MQIFCVHIYYNYTTNKLLSIQVIRCQFRIIQRNLECQLCDIFSQPHYNNCIPMIRQQIFEISESNVANTKKDHNKHKNYYNNSRITIKKVASERNLLKTCSQTNEQYFQNCANSTEVNPTHPNSVRGLIHKIKSVQRVGVHPSPNNNTKIYHKKEVPQIQKQREDYKRQQYLMQKYSNKPQDKKNLLYLVKQAVQIEQQRFQSENAIVYQQIKLIKKELFNLDEENSYLKQSITELQQENKTLNEKIVEIVNDITSLSNQLEEKEEEIKQYKLKQTQMQINQINHLNQLQQLNNVVQSLTKQNQYLVNQINFLNHSKPNLQMNINSNVLETIIMPSVRKRSQIDIKQKQLQQLEHQIINLQRRNYATINRINKQHEKQIQSLKNTFFKSLNYYKSMLMKCTTNSFVDFSKYPEDLLETAIMEVDQQGDEYLGDLEDIKDR